MGEYTYSPVAADAAIANAAALSAVIDTKGLILKAIIIPSTGWPAGGANMTLLTSTDNVTFYPVYDVDGSEVTFTVGILAASRAIRIPSGDVDLGRYLKLRSGTAAAPVNCTGCAIVAVLRPAA